MRHSELLHYPSCLRSTTSSSHLQTCGQLYKGDSRCWHWHSALDPWVWHVAGNRSILFSSSHGTSLFGGKSIPSPLQIQLPACTLQWRKVLNELLPSHTHISANPEQKQNSSMPFGHPGPAMLQEALAAFFVSFTQALHSGSVNTC